MGFQKGNRYGGRRSARTSNIVRTPTPQIQQDGSDEEMADVDDAQHETPQDDEEDEAATPAQDDDEDEADSPPTITAIPRRRRGRAGGLRHSSRMDISTPEPGEQEGSESGTPYRRRRGRPPGSGVGSSSGRGRGGFRGRRKGAQPEAPRVIDKDGNTLSVVDDEAVVDNDEEGNTKVDSRGNLLGGREYRVRTFTIIGRDSRLYMLSTEPARCCGFRDSYLFFTKHPKLYKVLLGEDAKKDLIDRDILPNSYKGRNIGVVTARSVFREFGARIIVGGRKIIDDYKVAEARERGDVEGELADPGDRIPENRGEYNRNRYVAWFGASDVYRSTGQGTGGGVGGGAVHHPAGKPGMGGGGKRRNNITVENWQVVHAREASRFNSATTALRRANLNGVYDTHTNLMFYPQIMQPTHARWEQIPPPSNTNTGEQTKPLINGSLPNGDHLPNGDAPPSPPSKDFTIFSPVPPIISRNFTIVDTVFSSPPVSQPGLPGPDSSHTSGLSSIPHHLLDELPRECRAAFEEARDLEMGWKKGWGRERDVGVGGAMRGDLKVGLSGFPV